MSAIFSAMFLVIMVAVIVMFFVNSKNAFRHNVKIDLASLARQQSFSFSTDMEQKKTMLETMALASDIYSMDKTKQTKAVAEQIKLLESKDQKGVTFQISDMNGDTYVPGTDAKFNLADEINFKNTVANKATVFTPLLISEAYGVLRTIITTPIYKNGDRTSDIIGVLGVVYNSEIFNDLILDDVPANEYDFRFVIDASGKKIAHTNFELLKQMDNDIEKNDPKLKDYVEVQKQMVTGATGSARVQVNGKNFLMNYVPIDGTPWFLCVAKYEDYVMKDLTNLQHLSLIISMVLMLIVVILSYMVSQSIAKPIKEVTGQIEQLSNYDLKIHIKDKYLNREDEIGDMSKSIETMVTNFRGVVETINSNANDTAQSTYNSSKDVASTISSIANGATEQAQYVQNATVSAEETKNVLEQMLSVLKKLEDSTDIIDSKKDEGKKTISELIDVLEHSKELSQKVGDVIADTNKSTEQISSASDMIQSISDQTNLLALNAAIDIAVVM